MSEIVCFSADLAPARSLPSIAVRTLLSALRRRAQELAVVLSVL